MEASFANQFQGKVALVTGSNSGIGEAVALTLAKRGASVTLTGRNVERLQNSLEKCVEASGGHRERFLSVSGDLKDSAFRKRLVDDTVAKFGKLDILVCNAGGDFTADNIDKATEESFDAQINIYVKSAFFLIQAALPHLEKSKGNVVNVSAILGHVAAYIGVIYSMCKAATDHMTRCLALDLASRGIRVNSVSPAYVRTRFWRFLPTEEENRAAMLQFEEHEGKTSQPLENRVVTVDEVAEGVCFLASNSASFVTGQNISIDGGRSLLGPTKV